MKTCPDCIPCILKQVNNVAREAGATPAQLREMLVRASGMFSGMDLSKSPAHNSTVALRLIPEITGVADPYRDKKGESNRMALELLPVIERHLKGSKDRLRTAALVAAAGNVIDLAIQGNRHAELEGVLETVIREGFAVDHIEEFRKSLESSRNILYLGDNAGEVVFDREFARVLAEGGRRVTFAIHGGPILNDALMDDALAAGMEKVVRVVSTGSDWIGLELETCDREFRSLFKGADLVVAKGHGNYETVAEMTGSATGSGEMTGSPAETYFILRAKCASVARLLGVEVGQVVFRRK